MTVTDFDTVLFQRLQTAWKASASQHTFRPGVSTRAISDVESRLERRFPASLAALYQFSDEPCICGGDLTFAPLLSPNPDKGIDAHSNFLRKYEWPIPPELVIFANNGGEELFGLWLPRKPRHHGEPPVIELGEIFEPGCMSIVGTSLLPFLLGRTAYYLQLAITARDPKPQWADLAFNALSLPARLQWIEGSDKKFDEICRWADPDLPPEPLSSYEARLNATELRARYGGDE